MAEPLDAIAPLPASASVESRVVEALRALIVSGELTEGTKLVHRQLAVRLGVSPTPVKLALSKLEEQGFVAVLPQGSSVVSHLTRERLEEIYVARRALEGLAARLGATRVTSEDLERMASSFAGLEEQAAGARRGRYLAERWTFHAVCYRAAGRPRLYGEVERLFLAAERFNHLLLSLPERFERSLGFYREFLDACRAGRGDLAEAVIRASTAWCVDQLSPLLPSDADMAGGRADAEAVTPEVSG